MGRKKMYDEEHHKAKRREWGMKNRDRWIEYNKKSYEKNKETQLQKKREYQMAKWKRGELKNLNLSREVHTRLKNMKGKKTFNEFLNHLMDLYKPKKS